MIKHTIFIIQDKMTNDQFKVIPISTKELLKLHKIHTIM